MTRMMSELGIGNEFSRNSEIEVKISNTIDSDLRTRVPLVVFQAAAPRRVGAGHSRRNRNGSEMQKVQPRKKKHTETCL